MSLDFAIVGEGGDEAETVAISMEQHQQLIDAARELKLYRLLRFHDYFEAIDIWPIELPGLLGETATLLNLYGAGATPGFLLELHWLMERALKQRQILYAVPD